MSFQSSHLLSSPAGRNTQNINREICVMGIFRSQSPRAPSLALLLLYSGQYTTSALKLCLHSWTHFLHFSLYARLPSSFIKNCNSSLSRLLILGISTTPCFTVMIWCVFQAFCRPRAILFCLSINYLPSYNTFLISCVFV